MFEHCMYFNTIALSRVLEREWTKAFSQFGLTPAQAFMLRAILDKPGLLQRELADELVITRPTATRLLDGLQDKGLVLRTTTQKDGREFSLIPTAKAQALKAKINAASAEVSKRVKRQLGVKQFDETVSQIIAVRTVLTEYFFNY